MTFETFDQSDEGRYPDQQKDNDKDKEKDNDKDKYKTETTTKQIHFENTIRERPKRPVTFETFDQSDEGT